MTTLTPSQSARMQLARILGFKEFESLVPIHQIPEGRDVIRSPVLIVEVIGVFPNVQTDDWGSGIVGNPFHQGRILIWRGGDSQGSVIPFDQPCPPRSESREGCLGERFFHGVQAAESGSDGVSQASLRKSTALRRKAFPEKSMV